MSRLRLSFVMSSSPWLEPLCSGKVEPEGIEILPTRSDPSEMFWRQLRFAEFDIAEMSLASFLIARNHGKGMVAVPAFPARRFMHTELAYHVDAGIDGPPALAGKRIGVAEYQQTSAVWTRGVLEHDFGVPPRDMTWFIERSAELSHGAATAFVAPPGVTLQHIPTAETLDSMLSAGRIDVAPAGRALWHEPNLIDRATHETAIVGKSAICPLFPDTVAEARRFFERYGFVPANHVVTIRGDVHERYPWVALNLYKALIAAKAQTDVMLPRFIHAALPLGGAYVEQTRALFGADPFPYGLEANRGMLEMFSGLCAEQGLVPAPDRIEELFAPSVL